MSDNGKANLLNSRLMKLVIVGHVDHGKSTLVGRLMSDTDSLPTGKLDFVKDICKRQGKEFEFAFLLDALEEEQDQGITIDTSQIFFNTQKFPIALVDTKKFSYLDQNKLNLEVELTIKGNSQMVPINLEIHHLAEELIQIKGKLKFSRTAFQIGIGKWASTAILKDKASIETNLFLFKQ